MEIGHGDIGGKGMGGIADHMSQADPTELDVTSFVRLFNSAVRDLRSYLRRTLRRDDDADEIAQEAMLRIWGARDTVSIETARPLLFRIASNLAIDRLREHRRWRFSDIADTDHATDAASADRVVAARQELAVIQSAIRTLPDKCRTAFVLSRIEGRKHAEIAAAMGISKSMVEKHVADAAFRLSLARKRSETTRSAANVANDVEAKATRVVVDGRPAAAGEDREP
jgi:RNA polymerase sigma factor (sigma-70 family)